MPAAFAERVTLRVARYAARNARALMTVGVRGSLGGSESGVGWLPARWSNGLGDMLLAFGRDLVESAIAAGESGLLAREILPAAHDDVDIVGRQLDAETAARGHLRGDQRRAGSQEGLEDRFARHSMVQNRLHHQRRGLLRRMVDLHLVRPAHDELRGRRVPDRAVLAGDAEPG